MAPKWASRCGVNKAVWERPKGLVKWIHLNGEVSVNLESGFTKKKLSTDIQSAEGLAGLPQTLIVHHTAWSLRWSSKGSWVRSTNIHETRQQRYQSTNESVSHRCWILSSVRLKTREIELKCFLLGETSVRPSSNPTGDCGHCKSQSQQVCGRREWGSQSGQVASWLSVQLFGAVATSFTNGPSCVGVRESNSQPFLRAWVYLMLDDLLPRQGKEVQRWIEHEEWSRH